jgi:hypothetical protein
VGAELYGGVDAQKRAWWRPLRSLCLYGRGPEAGGDAKCVAFGIINRNAEQIATVGNVRCYFWQGAKLTVGDDRKAMRKFYLNKTAEFR